MIRTKTSDIYSSGIFHCWFGNQLKPLGLAGTKPKRVGREVRFEAMVHGKLRLRGICARVLFVTRCIDDLIKGRNITLVI